MIEARGIRKIVKNGDTKTEQIILNDVSLKIEEGEFVSILGASGAGKSTLLYCLSGLESISGGSVSIGGKSIEGMREDALTRFRFDNLGIIFQNFHLIPMLTVKENIVFVAQMYKKDKKNESYLRELLEIVGLNEKENTPVANLSGGQQQRVAIARGLYMRPKILFADEPTGNLDSHTAEVITTLLEQVNHDLGTTIVQVTHAEDLAQRSGRIIKMKDGRVIN